MNIGNPVRTIIVEPAENPVPEKEPVPAKEPRPVREPDKAPVEK